MLFEKFRHLLLCLDSKLLNNCHCCLSIEVQIKQEAHSLMVMNELRESYELKLIWVVRYSVFLEIRGHMTDGSLVAGVS